VRAARCSAASAADYAWVDTFPSKHGRARFARRSAQSSSPT
jgi:hypothetical protein